MKISTRKPEIYAEIRKHFPAAIFEQGLIITYGETVYQTLGLKREIDKAKIVHEQVHVDQQTSYPGGPRAWWDRYFIDVDFRLSQEIPAYKKECEFFRANYKDRNLIARYMHSIAQDLSGPAYGNMMSYGDAYKVVTGKA